MQDVAGRSILAAAVGWCVSRQINECVCLVFGALTRGLAERKAGNELIMDVALTAKKRETENVGKELQPKRRYASETPLEKEY